jgi:autotransporter-associated beta strand protein
MNIAFRSLWNAATGSWVAVPETTRSCGKRSVSTAVAGATLALFATSFFPAQAACTAAGSNVNCSGAANPLAPSYANGSNNLNVTVNPGGSVGVLLGVGGNAMTLTGSNDTLTNNGRIDPTLLGTGLGVLSSGVVMGNASASTQTVTNNGTLGGTRGLSVVLTGMALALQNGAGGTSTITNTGTMYTSPLIGATLSGPDAGVLAAYGGAQVNVDNSGTITGRVALGTSTGGNTFVNSGTVNGSVSLGANSKNLFVATTDSSVNAAGGTALSTNLAIGATTINFAATGTVDGGSGGDNRLSLRQGTSATGAIANGSFLNFNKLDVESGTWALSGASGVSQTTLGSGATAVVDNALSLGKGTVTSNGGTVEAAVPGLSLANDVVLGAGGLTVAGANGVQLSGVISGGGDLTQTSGATLVLSGNNVYTGDSVVRNGTLQVASDANLGLGRLVLDGGTLAATGDLTSARSVVIQANTGRITSSGSAITLTGAIDGGGALSVQSNGGAISLTNTANDFRGFVNLAGGATQINAANSLTLGDIATGALTAVSGGALSLGQGSAASIDATSTSGAVVQGGAISVAGTTTVSAAAGTGAITLNNTGNDFGGVVHLTGGTTEITDANALTLGNLATGDLTATSNGALSLGQGSAASINATSNNGAIVQSGPLAVAGTTTLNAGTGTITLTQATNSFGGALGIAGGNTSIVAASGLTLGDGSVGGTLALTSGGAITQTGSLSVVGTSSFGATGAIALTDANNDFGAAVSLQGSSIAIRDRNDLTVSSLVNGTNGSVSVIAGGQLVLPSQAIDAGTGNVVLAAEGGQLGINNAVRGANVTLGGRDGIALAADVETAGTLSLNSGQGIAQSSGMITAGTLTGSAAGAVTLSNEINQIGTLGDFSAQGLTVKSSLQLNVTGKVDGGASTYLMGTNLSISGTVSGTSTVLNSTGSILQTQSGAIVADTLSGSAVGVVDLTGANMVATLGDFDAGSIPSFGDFSFANGRALSITGNVIAGNLSFDVSKGAVVTGSLATRAPGGTTTIAAGTRIQIGDGGTAGSISGDVVANGELAFDRSDTVSFGGSIGGSGSLTQAGSGSLDLTGASTYAGGTTVAAGTLSVNNKSGSVTGTGAVQVQAGATLAGNGSIAGAVTVDKGGVLSAGNGGAGTLTLGSLSLNAGSVLNYELGQAGVAGGSLNDLINVNGNLQLDGTLNVSETAGGKFGAGLYRLINYTGTLTDNGLDIGTAPTATKNLQVQTAVANQVNLVNSEGVTLTLWDGSDPANFNDGKVAGGSGTWRAGGSTASWTGIDGKLNGGWQQDGVAIFSGQAGTVTVDNKGAGGPVRLGGAQFAVNGYTVNGDALTISAPQTVVRVGDGTGTSAGMTATINAAIGGTGGLVKDEGGTLVLGGNNSYTGGTTVKGGILQISADNNLGAAGTGLALDGGTLRIATGSGPLFVPRTVALGVGGGTIDVGNSNFAVSGPISGNGQLRVTGKGGTLGLVAANSYSGGTVLQDGITVSAVASGVFGSGAVQQQGDGSFVFLLGSASAGNNSYSVGRAASSDRNNRLAFGQTSTGGTANITVNGLGWWQELIGGNALQFGDNATAGTATISNLGGSVYFLQNGSAGSATIANGNNSLLNFLGSATAGNAKITNGSGGLVRFADSSTGAQATVINDFGGMVDVSGSTAKTGVALGSLSGVGGVALGATQLTLGSLNTNDTLSGPVNDKGSLFSQPGSGIGGSIVKVGSGTLTLSEANSYTGGTTVAAGTLSVNNVIGSATGTGAVQVQSGATLAGNGKIAGAVTVANGGVLSAGNVGVAGGAGTLTVGGLDLSAGSVLNYQLGQAGVAGGSLNDLINVNGNLQLDGTLNVAETAGGKFGAGLYRLINYTGTLTDNGLDIGTAPTSKLSVQTSVANQVNLLNSDGLVLNLWDGGNSANFNDGKIAGGAGTWRAGAPGDNWTDANGLANGTWVQDGFAIFGGQAGTVTVDNKGAGGAVRLGGAQFAVDGYTINGDPLTITAPQTVVRVGDGSSASAGMTATIAASIGGAGGLVKDDGGTLVLTGNNSYAGGTTVKGGILQISADNNLGAFGKGLALDGGTLRIAAGSTPFFSMRALALGAGGGTIDLGNSIFGVGGLISGNGLLTVTGKGGTLGLVTANSYSGGTLLQDGASITTTVSGVLGSGAVRQQGNGTLLLYTDKASAGGNDYTVGRAASADAGNMLLFSQNATAASSKITLNGATWQMLGANSVQFSGNTSAGTSNITNAGGAISFFENASAGSATIANGGKSLLGFGGTATAGSAQISNAFGGLVRFADSSSGAGATVGNAAGGVVDVSGSTAKTGVELGSLSGAGGVVLGATRLTVGGLNTTDTLWGTVSDKGSVFTQPGSGTGGSIVKVGAGTLTLSGANTYTGGTTVAAGTLAVNNFSGSATGMGAVLVQGGATLAGSGSIAGAVSIAKGGVLSAGNGGPGTLTVGGLSLADGAVLNYDLGQANTVGGPLNDLVNVNGDLRLDGTLNVAQSTGGSFGAGLYRLISYTSGLIDAGLDIGTAPGAKTDLQVQTSVAKQVNLVNRAGLSLNFWDGGDPGKYNDGQIAGGSGTWRVGVPGDGWTGADGKINAAWVQDQFAVFSGTASIVSVDGGNGTVRITGAQFATDGYRVQGDAIQLGNAATTVRVGDGTAASAGMTATIASSLTGTGGLVKEDLGTLVLDGSNSYSGGTTVKGGILQIASDANLGAATGGLALEGATLHVTGDTAGTRAVSLGAGSNTFDIDLSRTLALNGAVSGAGGLRKTGLGTLQLGAANGYAGGTEVAAGSLQALVTDALGTGPVSVAGNASLAFTNKADAGKLAITLAQRGSAPTDNGGFLAFSDSSSAGSATITANKDATVEFRDTSSAGNAVIENRGGITTLWFNANGGKAQITNFDGGQINLLDDASAGQARFVNESGGLIDMYDRVSADQATVVNNAGGLLRISKLATAGVGIGSLEGAGNVQLGAKALTTGGLNTSTTVSGTISGAGGSLVKVGSGTLSLTGANTYTGGTTIAAGTLAVNNASGSATGAGAVQVQSGGTLAGNGSVAGAVSIAKGGVLSAGNAGVGTLTLGGLNLAEGAVLNYDLGQANTVGGALNDRVQVNGNLQLDGTLNVVQSKGGVFGAGIYRLIDYTGSLTDNGLDIGSAPIAAKDLQVQTSVAQQVNLVNRTGLSLNFWDGGDNTKYNDGKIAGGTGTWRVGVPGDGWTGADGKINAAWAQDQFAVFSGTGGTVTVSNAGGTVRINGAQFAADGYVLQGDAIELGASGTVVRVGDGSGTDVDRTATVNVALTGAGGLVKDDVGRLVLGGTNTYTGGTTVKAGVLQGNTDSLQGGLVNDAEVVFDQAKTGTYAGTMSGTGKLRKIGAGTLTLTSANSYAGGTSVDAGTLATDVTGALGSGAASVASGGTLQLGGGFDAGTTAIGNQGTVRFQDKASAGTSTITNAAGGVLAFADDATADKATVLNQAGAQVRIDQSTAGVSFGSLSGAGEFVLGAKALTLGASGDNTTLSGTISGNGGSIVKVGGGTLTLTGANTYTGGTTVGAGTLSVNNKSGSATGTGAVQVQSGATLAGSGSIAGAVTIDKGGILAAGNSPGTLTLGALTLAGGSTLNYELGQAGVPGGALNDLINVTGNLQLDGTLNIAQSAGGSFGPGLYRLMSYGGSFTDNGLDIGTVPGSAKAADLQVQTSVANQVNLVNKAGLSLNFWDGGDSTKYNDGQIAGGSGTWRVGNPQPSMDAWTDMDGKVNANWAQNQFAVFGGKAGTVTVDATGGAVRIAGAQFATDGYVVQGDGIVVDNANSVIRVGDGTAAGAAMTASLNVALSGTGGISKEDAGRLILGGANTYTGGTTVKGGVLQGSATSLQGNIVNNAEVAFDQGKTAGTYAGVMSGTGKLRKIGTGTLTLSSANSYSGGTLVDAGTLTTDTTGALGTGAVSIASGAALQFGGKADAGKLAIANAGTLRLQDTASAAGATVTNAAGAQVRIDLTTTGTSIGSLGGAGDVVLGTKALTTGALGTDNTISGSITGATGSLVKVGTGTLTLSGTSNYAGETRVTGGTLKAGASNAFSAASSAVVASGATLDLGGFSQKMAGLTNAGTVSLLGTVPGTTLTLTGPYVGNNGVLRLGAKLDNPGIADRLVLDGASASASGKTTVQVTNLGGLGARTSGAGIELISAKNGATTTAQTSKDAFVLSGGRVDAGAYEYRLYAGDAGGEGENWYLRTEAEPGASLPTYRAEASLFAALPNQLRQSNLGMLASLSQRIGDDDVRGSGGASTSLDGGNRRAWGRLISTDMDIRQGGTVSPHAEGRVSGLQAGTDLWANANWRAGIYVGQLEGDTRVSGFSSGLLNGAAGRNDLRSQYLGLYGTFTSDDGFYADTVLQAGRHRYTVQPQLSAGVTGKGNSFLASIEVGKAFALGTGGWSVEPQLQLIHQRLRLDDVAIPGALVQQDADSSWTARAGVRIKGSFATSAGTLQPYARLNVYRSSKGNDVARFVNPAAITPVGAPIGGTSTELAAGFTLALSQRTSLYGELGKQWASGGVARVGSSVNAGVGVRVKW